MSEPLPDRGSSKDEGSRSLFSALPSFPAEAVVAERIAATVCDECEQPKAGTGSYTVLHIIFLVLFVVWRFDSVFKCPRCMRAYLLQRLPLSLLLSTVFAPLIVVWWGVLFVRTLGR
jgi:hypothetical protein